MEQARLFLGGRGLGARLLWDLVGPEVDALAPENALIFATGPLTATGYQTSNRFSVSTKSPLTGTIMDANSGGFWGMQFKKTGYDALIVTGKSEKPVWLEITSDTVALHDATDLWGQRVSETTTTLEQDNNKRNVMCIGPAGENLSPITNQTLPEFGSAVVLNIVNYFGALPTHNFRQSQFESAEAISGEALTEQYLVRKIACWACPMPAPASPREKTARRRARI